jgi:hypothetical protein
MEYETVWDRYPSVMVSLKHKAYDRISKGKLGDSGDTAGAAAQCDLSRCDIYLVER